MLCAHWIVTLVSLLPILLFSYLGLSSLELCSRKPLWVNVESNTEFSLRGMLHLFFLVLRRPWRLSLGQVLCYTVEAVPGMPWSHSRVPGTKSSLASHLVSDWCTWEAEPMMAQLIASLQSNGKWWNSRVLTSAGPALSVKALGKCLSLPSPLFLCLSLSSCHSAFQINQTLKCNPD